MHPEPSRRAHARGARGVSPRKPPFFTQPFIAEPATRYGRSQSTRRRTSMPQVSTSAVHVSPGSQTRPHAAGFNLRCRLPPSRYHAPPLSTAPAVNAPVPQVLTSAIHRPQPLPRPHAAGFNLRCTPTHPEPEPVDSLPHHHASSEPAGVAGAQCILSQAEGPMRGEPEGCPLGNPLSFLSLIAEPATAIRRRPPAVTTSPCRRLRPLLSTSHSARNTAPCRRF